jgi:general secretion pathway protein G
MKKAFTMVELVFVIVVIGILSAIAIPKFAATRDDAIISKALAEVSAMRSAIATERQKRILRGDFTDIVAADITGTPSLLEYGLSSNWTGLSFSGGTKSCTFTVTGNKLVKASGCTLPGI